MFMASISRAIRAAIGRELNGAVVESGIELCEPNAAKVGLRGDRLSACAATRVAPRGHENFRNDRVALIQVRRPKGDS